MSASDEITEYHASLEGSDRAMCEHLRAVFAHALPDAEGKIWHRHPVWFIGGNPIVGYHRLKDGVRV